MNSAERIEARKVAKVSLDKDFGKGTVMSLSDRGDMDIEVISTGSLGLDIALGIGGLPKGRIIEAYGMESSGKTTMAIHLIAEAHKNPESICAIIDAEHSFDMEYAANLGVDISRLDINQPEFGEQGLEVAEKLISSGAYDVIVIDSVAALVPKAELEDEMGTQKMGLQARMMGQACRKLAGTVKKTNTILLFLNQQREKIGVMYGSPLTTSGGNALKFYASVRLEVTRSTTSDNSIKNGDEILGNLTKVKVIKNKVAPPFKNCEFNILYGIGIDKIGEIVKLANDLEILKKWGKTITYNNEKYEVPVFESMLLDNSEFYDDLRKQVLERVGAK